MSKYSYINDPEIREEVFKQFDEGVSPKEIAINTGISVTTIRLIINNGENDFLLQKNRDITKRMKINAYKDYVAGMSKDEICHKYNRGRNWLNQAIVSVRKWQDEALELSDDEELLSTLTFAEHKKEYPIVYVNGKRYIDVSADWL